MANLYSLNTTIETSTGSADVDIPLVRKCDRCDGLGKTADYTSESFTECLHCDGDGTRLTANGQDVLRFVRDYANNPDIDIDNLD